jgi:hypothetical protein
VAYTSNGASMMPWDDRIIPKRVSIRTIRPIVAC